jgi:hypothetical protein
MPMCGRKAAQPGEGASTIEHMVDSYVMWVRFAVEAYFASSRRRLNPVLDLAGRGRWPGRDRSMPDASRQVLHERGASSSQDGPLHVELPPSRAAVRYTLMRWRLS